MHADGSLKLRWSAVSETGSDALARDATPAQYALSKYFIFEHVARDENGFSADLCGGLECDVAVTLRSLN